MRLIAVDPGDTVSALVLMEPNDRLMVSRYESNESLLDSLRVLDAEHLAIETLHVRGQPTSQNELDTQLWAGRFICAWDGPFTLVRRERVKGHFGASGVSNPDGVLRESLIGRFGGEAVAVGGKRCRHCNGKGWRGRDHHPCELCKGAGVQSHPGVFYGWSGTDLFSACAIACWWFDTQAKREAS